MSSAYIFSGSVFAADKYEIALVAKVNGVPWFNRMGVGVKEAADKLNVNAYQTGPATPDPAQQVKVIEDLIAKNVSAIIVVPNDATVLEPVLKKHVKKVLLFYLMNPLTSRSHNGMLKLLIVKICAGQYG